jgi:histone H3/H4
MDVQAAARLAANRLGLDPSSAPEELARLHEAMALGWGEVRDAFVAETSAEDPPPTPSLLPTARLRRLIKGDGAVQSNLSMELLAVTERAVQLLVADLTKRAFWFSERNDRRVVQQEDVVLATMSSRDFDFLEGVLAPSEAAGSAPPVGGVGRPQRQRRKTINNRRVSAGDSEEGVDVDEEEGFGEPDDDDEFRAPRAKRRPRASS